MLNSISTALLTALTLVGCATDGADRAGPGGAGGKADGDEALHIEARVTKLGELNEIRWPVAVDTSSEVDNVMNAKLGFEAVTGENLDELKAKWAAGGDGPQQGVDEADFEITANVRNVLSVAIRYETIYAYIDFHHAYLNFNPITGAEVAITDLLDAASLPGLAAKLDHELQARIAKLKTDYAAEITNGEVEATQWDGLHVRADDLASFSTTQEGITFHYDPGFPHALVALAPDGEFAVAFEDLDAAIRTDGLWAGEY